MRHIEVEGRHLQLHDEIRSPDGSNVWREIVQMDDEGGSDFVRLLFLDSTGMMVKAHEPYRIRRPA